MATTTTSTWAMWCVSPAAQVVQGQTQRSLPSTRSVIGAATVEPVDVTLPFPSADYLERYEVCSCACLQTLYATEFFQRPLRSGGPLQVIG
ncbi:MAG: hypothetical protein R2873_36455 [Caldilineaceae bacterium]